MKDFAFNGKDLLDHVSIGVENFVVLFERLLPFFGLTPSAARTSGCGNSTIRQEMSSIKELTEP